MDTQRNIVNKLFESRRIEESSIEINGSKYSCVFGKYYKDGEQITRDDYMKATRQGTSVSTKTALSKKSKDTKGSWSKWLNNSHGESYPFKDYVKGNLVGTIHDATKDGEGYIIDFYDNDTADEHVVDGLSNKSFKTEKEAQRAIENYFNSNSGNAKKKSNSVSKKKEVPPTPKEIDNDIDEIEHALEGVRVDDETDTDDLRDRLDYAIKASKKLKKYMDDEDVMSDEQYGKFDDLNSRLEDILDQIADIEDQKNYPTDKWEYNGVRQSDFL